MRPIWKGSIAFGLVNIPVALVPATKREELRFHLLRASDLSPIDYKRVAEADGREVPWSEIVKGYEYAKGKFVVLKDEDFKRVDIEATETVAIIDFVQLDEVNPMYFTKPYYLEPLKGGAGAYALLRDVLRETHKAGIAKVVIKTRQHLAALKPNGNALVLELMYFAHELVPADELRIPEKKTPGRRELAMAKALVEQMTEEWDPARYTDDYTSALMGLIERKVDQGGHALPAARRRGSKQATNVIDLVAVLQRSLSETGAKKPASRKSPRAKRKPARTSRRRAA